MPEQSKKNKSAIALIRGAGGTLMEHKVIFFPFAIIVFFQLFFLEIFYFSPRFPLKIFFGPIIRTFWSEGYLHFPLNLQLLPHLYQLIQGPLFILIGSFCIALAVDFISVINKGKPINVKASVKRTFSQYIHIILAGALAFLFLIVFFKMVDLVYNRAILIRSTKGVFHIIKLVAIVGAPYFRFLLSIIGTTLFAYVFAFIVLEKQKVWVAVWNNFKLVFRSLGLTFLTVLLPSLLYLPIILILTNTASLQMFPEANVLIVLLNIFVLFIIDSVIYTALTSYYLLDKESK